MVFEAALFNDTEHVGDVLDQDPGDVGEGVEVASSRIAQGSAGHETQVIERGMQALAGAGVEFGQWDGFIDEQDGLGGGDRGERSEAA